MKKKNKVFNEIRPKFEYTVEEEIERKIYNLRRQISAVG